MRRRLALALSLPLAAVLVAPSLGHAEPHARPREFKCLLKGKKPEGKDFYVFNRNRAKLRKAVAMSQTGVLPDKGYPVGTILQVLPFEAMIKRGPGFNPEGDDWEFVRLAATPDGRTEIRADGKGEVTNALGSCQGCHKALAQHYDLVCGFVVGASGLGLTEEQLANLQASDPRCQKK